MIAKNAVAVDADFFLSVTHLDQGEFFKQMMDEMQVVPVMHPYVAEVELALSEPAKQLLTDGYIQKLSYDEFLKNESERKKYQEDVWMLFVKENGNILPRQTHPDIYEKGFRLSQGNLGEIMTELMARELHLTVFMSNDKGAIRIAKRHINSCRYTLSVKNLVNVLREIGGRENSLKWKKIKAVLDAAKLSKYKKELWALWNEKT